MEGGAGPGVDGVMGGFGASRVGRVHLLANRRAHRIVLNPPRPKARSTILVVSSALTGSTFYLVATLTLTGIPVHILSTEKEIPNFGVEPKTSPM